MANYDALKEEEALITKNLFEAHEMFIGNLKRFMLLVKGLPNLKELPNGESILDYSDDLFRNLQYMNDLSAQKTNVLKRLTKLLGGY